MICLHDSLTHDRSIWRSMLQGGPSGWRTECDDAVSLCRSWSFAVRSLRSAAGVLAAPRSGGGTGSGIFSWNTEARQILLRFILPLLADSIPACADPLKPSTCCGEKAPSTHVGLAPASGRFPGLLLRSRLCRHRKEEFSLKLDFHVPIHWLNSE